MSDEPRFTVIVVPSDREGTRTFEVTRRAAKAAAVTGGVLLLAGLMMAGSWLWLAGQAARVPGLSSEVRSLRREQAQVQQLATQLRQITAEYAKVRSMLGADSTALPRVEETAPAAKDSARGDDAEPEPDTSRRAYVPRRWPLEAKGFVTRGLTAPHRGAHPGMDIAVAAGSRILASGAGVVVEAGEDSVYGRFVRISHPGGWESLYAHASALLVHPRERVGAGKAIALSGNSGVSTAPHLHFEIRRNGRPVDPVTMIDNPNPR